MESLHEKCKRRVSERETLRSMSKHFDKLSSRRRRAEVRKIKSMIVDVENTCVTQAVARLPEGASFDLVRQVIREAKA